MARTASVDLTAALRAECSTLARIWRITRPDGTIVRLTDAVEDFKLGTEVFYANVGFSASAVYQSMINQAGQSLNLVTAFNDLGITRDDIIAGKYVDAAGVLSVVDYSDPDGEEMVLFSGNFGRPKWSNRDVLTIEVLPKTSGAVFIANEKWSDTCRNMLGDSKCTVNIEMFKTVFTVAAITGDVLSFSSTQITQPDNYYALGHIIWDTGPNAGTTSDVRLSFVTGAVSLFYKTENAAPAIGDTGRIYPGCDLTVNTCLVRFNNLNRNRSEPFRPTWVVAKGLPNGGGGGNSPTGVGVGGGGGARVGGFGGNGGGGPTLIGP